MRNPFTLRRWRNSPWQLFALSAIGWTSMWQIVDSTDPARVSLSIANMVGATIALIAMVIRDDDTARGVERWAYIMLIWSLSCYLAFALRWEGWWGLVHQPNLGITLTEAAVFAMLYRIIWGGFIRKRIQKHKVKCEAAKLITEYHKKAA